MKNRMIKYDYIVPTGSMYDISRICNIYLYIWQIFEVNVGKYTFSSHASVMWLELMMVEIQKSQNFTHH